MTKKRKDKDKERILDKDRRRANKGTRKRVG
jgi:hypothetical protein